MLYCLSVCPQFQLKSANLKCMNGDTVSKFELWFQHRAALILHRLPLGLEKGQRLLSCLNFVSMWGIYVLQTHFVY